jgi:hypothetical protein
VLQIQDAEARPPMSGRARRTIARTSGFEKHEMFFFAYCSFFEYNVIKTNNYELMQQ